MAPSHLPGLLARFRLPEFYLSEEAAREAIRVCGQFNIIHKEGQSERHLRDIAGMLRISGTEIDTRYVSEWAQRLGLSDIWEAILRRATEE